MSNEGLGRENDTLQTPDRVRNQVPVPTHRVVGPAAQPVAFEFEESGPGSTPNKILSILRYGLSPEGCICHVLFTNDSGKQESRICYVAFGKQGGFLVHIQKLVAVPNEPTVVRAQDWFQNEFSRVYSAMFMETESV